MKTTYKRIDLHQRIIIEKLLALGKTQEEIADAIGYSKSAVCRDIKLCEKNNYSAIEATRISVGNTSNRRNGKSKIVHQKALGKVVLKKLDLRWSPEQIHLFLKKKYTTNLDMQISIESIYFYIYIHTKPELKKLLVSQLRQKRAYRGNVRRGVDKDRKSVV